MSYPIEPEQSREQARQAGIKRQVDSIDNEKQEILYRSVNISMDSSPKREKFFEQRKFTGILSRMDSEVAMRSISNFEEVYNDNEEVEEDSFAN